MKTPLKTILMKFLDRFQQLEIQESLYENEFQNLKHLTNSLKGNSEYSYSSGMKDINRLKNRYKDIVPYDFCRVVLPELSVPGTDYINASYVKGATGAFAYIAAQGPLPNTINDFWRMIWVCEVSVIIMACNEKEGGKTKCERYWAEDLNRTKQFGEISVEFVSELQICPDFLVRSLLVKQEGDSQRKVWQFHYATWPDHSVPDTVQPILQMVRMMRRCQAAETAPILVHCSAGCGRTGTICAIDFVWALLRRGKLTENFCLHDIVSDMRKQRIAMVQTKEQYVLVYKAVAAMFEQQLRIIDSHPYENLDEDGTPLTSKGTDDPLQHLYSEISACSGKEDAISTERKSNGIAELLPGSEKDFQLNNSVNGYRNQDVKDRANNVISNSSVGSTGFFQGPSSCENMPMVPLASADESQLNISDISGQKSEVDSSDTNICDMSYDMIRNKHLDIADKGLKSGISSESIPFIDDDDTTKSEICVRPRCGRGYIQRPSYDCIPKFITPFDPFVDTAFDNSYKSASQIFTATTPSTAASSKTSSMVSVHTMPFKVSEPMTDEIPNQNDRNLTKPQTVTETTNTANVPEDVTFEPTPTKISSFQLYATIDVATTNQEKCKAVNSLDVKPLEKPLPRRSSLTRFGLKSLFEKSKAKSEGKSSLFRYHSHHVSRAGSAPPSLSSMSTTNDSEKETLFELVSRKFRSSSVKSEHELRKEAGTTSQFSSLKKSAVNSFVHLKQNISNFSRTLNLNKYSQKTSSSQPTSTNINNFVVASTKNDEKVEVVPKNFPNSYWYDNAPMKAEKQKLSPVINQSDEAMESIQQKFVVNVLSSGHNKIVIGKPSSPKSKTFNTEKLMPKLISFGSSAAPKNNASTMWYYNEHGVTVNSKNEILEDRKPTLDVKTIKQNSETPVASPPSIATTTDGNQTTKEIKKSIFYTEIQNDSGKPFLPVKKKDAVLYNNHASDSNNITSCKTDKPDMNSDNSKSFWPSNSVVGPQKKGSDPLKSGAANVSNLSSDLNVSSSESSVDNPVYQKDENGMDRPPTVTVDKSERLESFVPPELPKKTVIGRHRSLMFPSFGESTAFSRMVDSPDTDPKTMAVACDEQNCAQQKENIVIISEPAAKNTKARDNLYTNVNVVAKKNIEQIENTLRNHPRGAIIDLTSRNSYSLDEELATAIKKLPDPMQKHRAKFSLSQLANLKRAGYEVIWPTSDESGHFLLTSDLNCMQNKNLPLSESADLEKEKLKSNSKSPSKLSEKSKLGICYSPPLKRSALATFPVLKSQSCARLDWLEKGDTALENTGRSLKSDSSGTLVNDAVVELSTLLDELTTRTLKDDLELKQNLVTIPLDECMTEDKLSSAEPICSQESELTSAETDISLNASSRLPEPLESISPPEIGVGLNVIYSSEPVVPLTITNSPKPPLLQKITSPQETSDLMKTASLSESWDFSKMAEPQEALCLPKVADSLETSSPTKTADPPEMASNPKIADSPEIAVYPERTGPSETVTSSEKSTNVHNYETIFRPQVPPPRQKKDEEIIFHFPPPPSVPPPPQKYIEVESFDIVCKDGMLHVKPLTNSLVENNTSHDSQENLQAQLSHSSTVTQLPPPVPLPRRKQINLQNPGNLRKSASYTTLVSQLPLHNQTGNWAGERCQTLPRLLIDESAYVFESALSQSVTDFHSLENKASHFQPLPPAKKQSNYETVFPQVKPRTVSQASVSTQVISNVCESVERGIECNSDTKLPLMSKNNDDLMDESRSSVMLINEEIKQKSEMGKKASKQSRSREDIFGKSSLPSESKERESGTSKNQNSMYGRIDKSHQQHRQRLVSADGYILKTKRPDSESSLDIQKQKRKSIIPSRKLQHAPPPPIQSVKSQTEGNSSIMNVGQFSEKVVRKHAPKPHERTSATSHAIQRSASAKDFSRNSAQNKAHSIPTYSVVHKPKLHAVLENISDSQNFVNSSVLSSSNHPKAERHLKNSSGYSLQYSQSDVSVHKKLREKFLNKSQHLTKASGNISVKSASDNSNKGHSFNSEKPDLNSDDNLNKQSAHKTATNQHISTPVAPPRARRRSTIEIDFYKAKSLAGASNSPNVSQKIGSSATCESLPAVPVKTKDAYELPEEFSHNNRKHQERSAGKSKALDHQLLREE